MTPPTFDFRPLTEADLLLLCEWLNRPYLQEWWRRERVTLEDVGGDRGPHFMRPCV